MSDDLSKVDWGRHLIATHRDSGAKTGWVALTGNAMDGVREVRVGGGLSVWVGKDGVSADWLITNAEQDAVEVARNSEAPSDAITLTADQAAMLRKVLTAIGAAANNPVIADGLVSKTHQLVPMHLIQEARDALALLPEPVDADLVEARKMAADDAFHLFKDKVLAQEYLGGDMDDSASVRFALAAIRRGRALECDSREG